jgi:tyrosyl-tRNA synthetase
MMKTLPAREQFEILSQGVLDLVTADDLLSKLERSSLTGKPLLIKYGADPSRPDIHLGHAVCFLKMRQFQDLGHEVVFVIGDFTARIGDPSGRSTVRSPLTREEVEVNARTYKEQVDKILNPDKTRVVYNADWLDPLTLREVVRLGAQFTVAQMLERDDFQKRFTGQVPIYIHEFLYALMVAYDSVALNCDVEMGGHDQLFNFLVGRDLMRSFGQEPQVCLTMPILEGTDGFAKMSKSMDNYIGVTDSPEQIFGRVMSVPDEVMGHYWTYLNLATPVEWERMQKEIGSGALHPRTVKLDLAQQIVTWLHSAEEGRHRREEFEKVFTRKEIPSDIPERTVSLPLDLASFLVSEGLAESKSEVRRLLKQAGIRLNEEPIPYSEHPVLDHFADGAVLRVGKKKFLRLRIA